MRTERAGMPRPFVDALVELHAVMATDARSPVSGDVQRITGQVPRSLLTFATDHAAHWSRRRGEVPLAVQ